MELFLVRHGEAKSEIEDPACPLTERGAEAVRRMALWAARTGLRVDQIRHSGKLRAEQTAALLAEQLEPPRGVIAVAGLKPNDAVEPVAVALQDRQESLMLVGHLPFLARLAALLRFDTPGGPAPRFVNAEIARLSSHNGTWSVDWVMTPDRL